MTVLVTGVAGFVGSHLAEDLVRSGREVRGLDAFTDYYARSAKERNLADLRTDGSFVLVEGDLATTSLEPLLDGVEVVYHLAGQPGVRPSWGADFHRYVHHNVTATQRLLEACRNFSLAKFVYASSSSVYGNAESYPTAETMRPQPVSPYGVTKLAGEHLCEVYRTAFGVPTVSLRLFTVYGPRQRPDMAFSRLVAAGIDGTAFELYGDGSQTRDFTYVSDVVRAMRSASTSPWCGVANVGGGSRTSMNTVIELLEELCGPIEIHRGPPARGDVRHTAADTTVAREAFGYIPQTTLRDGLALMVDCARRTEHERVH
jgi:nucleoside-diphosphate-sugar epimerase